MNPAQLCCASRLCSLPVIAERSLTRTRPEFRIGERVVKFSSSPFDFRVPRQQFGQSRLLRKTRAENAAGRAKRNRQESEKDKPHGEAGTGCEWVRGGEYIEGLKLPIDEFDESEPVENRSEKWPRLRRGLTD